MSTEADKYRLVTKLRFLKDREQLQQGTGGKDNNGKVLICNNRTDMAIECSAQNLCDTVKKREESEVGRWIISKHKAQVKVKTVVRMSESPNCWEL